MKATLPNGIQVECTPEEFMLITGVPAPTPPPVLTPKIRTKNKRLPVMFQDFPNGDVINEMLVGAGFRRVSQGTVVKTVICPVHGPDMPAYTGEARCVICHREEDRRRKETE